MKKQLLALLTILIVFGACQKNEVTSLSEDVTIHATIEEKDAARTVMDENNNILWSENDQIIAFMKSSYGYKYQVKPSFVGKSYADFSMVSSGSSSDLSAGNEWEHNVVYYPYLEDIECLKSGANYALEVNLPAEQAYVPNSFANGSMAMVAVSENNNITFKNVLGGIKLQLKGTQIVKSIKIEGKNNEKLSGAAVVTAYTDGNKPAISMASDASTSVTLNCGAGVQLDESFATEFIIALPPVTFCKGFTVTIADTEDQTYTAETTNTNSVLRSSLLIMPEITIDNLQEMQFAKHVAVFELAGAWCVFCPDGNDLMNMILNTSSMKQYKEAVHIMSFHSDCGGEDILAIKETDEIMDDINIDAIPSFFINMQTAGELTSDNTTLFRTGIKDAFDEHPAHCGVSISSKITDNKVKANVKVYSEKRDLYQVAIFVVEDKISYYQKTTVGQYEDYSHRNVVRKIITSSYKGDSWGEIEAGTEITKIYEFDVDPVWNLDNTYIYALVIDDECGVNNMNICEIEGESDYKCI